jgi:transcriptional regulator with XRE-family HTH domain
MTKSRSKSRRQKRGSQAVGRLQAVQKRFGNRIAALRKKKGLTQQQLAKGCGTATAKIQKIEDGELNASISTIIHLGERLGIKLHRLLRGIE